MRLVNLTDFTIRLYDAEGVKVVEEIPTDPPSVVAYSETVQVSEDPLVVRREYNVDADQLPEPEEGVMYIVGFAVLQALDQMGVERTDLIAPDTTYESVVRNAATKRTEGVRRFRTL